MRAVFGLSFGEIIVIGIVALVVVGPRNLPTLLRTLAEGLARFRKMASDIRAESGIDEALELDGLRAEIQRLRSLTNVETLLDTPPPAPAPKAEPALPDREKEYPRIGVDSYGAIVEEDPSDDFETPEGPDFSAATNGSTTVPASPPR